MTMWALLLALYAADGLFAGEGAGSVDKFPVALSTAGPGWTRLSTRLVLALAVCTPLSLGASSSLAHGQEDDQHADHPTLQWTLESSHATLAPDATGFYVRFRLRAAKEAARARQPLNLALVFDRSGSMKEESKIGYLRQAGHLVTDNLTPQDHVALVAYNHQVQTLVPMHPVVNREYLHHRIDELHAAGQTNLSGGLLEGCAEVGKRLGQPGLHHVILLTDGLANRGVIDPDKLVELVKRSARGGTTVTTIGVGIKYNETLLSRLAQAGGGRYVYVAEPEQIPEALHRELGALLAVVAQNVKLKMELPPGVEVQQVFGREEPLQPGVVEVPLGDLTSGQRQVILVKLRLAQDAQAGGPIELRAVLTYDEVAEAQRVESQQTLTMNPAAAGGVVEANQVSEVLAYARLVEAVDKLALAVEGMDRKLAAEVLEIRNKQYPALKQAALKSGDQEFFNKAFLFEHYARELQELIETGALHSHSEERAKLQKELHYRRYLMEHHRHRH